MAIRFQCQCGKQLQAKDEFGGRRMRCPGCGTVLTIPTPGVEVAEAPIVPERPMPPQETLRPAAPPPVPVVESPRPPSPSPVPPAETPRVRPAPASPPPLAGDSPRGNTPEAPRPAPARAVAKPEAAALPTANPWVDRSLEQTMTPWRDDQTRKRGSVGWVWRREAPVGGMGAAVLLLFVVGGAVVAGMFWPRIQQELRSAKLRSPSPFLAPETADLIPPNTAMFLSFRPAELKPLLEKHGEPLSKNKSLALLGLSGAGQIVSDKVEQLTLVVLPGGGGPLTGPRPGVANQYFIVNTRDPIDEASLDKFLNVQTTPERDPVSGLRYHRVPDDLAVALVTDTLFVFGSVEALRNVLPLRRSATRDQTIARSLASLGDYHVMAFLDQSKFFLQNGGKIFPQGGEYVALTLVAKISEKSGKSADSLQMELWLTYPDAKRAKNATVKAGEHLDKIVLDLNLQKKKADEFLRSLETYVPPTTAVGALGLAELTVVGHLYFSPVLADAFRPAHLAHVKALDAKLASLNRKLFTVKQVKEDLILGYAGPVTMPESLTTVFWEGMPEPGTVLEIRMRNEPPPPKDLPIGPGGKSPQKKGKGMGGGGN